MFKPEILKTKLPILAKNQTYRAKIDLINNTEQLNTQNRISKKDTNIMQKMAD
jgi:hypothetical protein